MQIIPADEVADLCRSAPEDGVGIVPHWWEGPHDDGRLNAGVVTVMPGGVTPPHVHEGGQVMIAVSGTGFVEADGRRTTLRAGDVVVTPAGELHTHGAEGDGPFCHLNVTAGGYSFPGQG